MFIWPSEEKDSNTCAFSRAEAWQRSTAKDRKNVVSMKSLEIVCPSAFFNRVAQYVHLHTGGMHAFFQFTCLLISFAKYLF